jgi:dienelactone hydrolase
VKRWLAFALVLGACAAPSVETPAPLAAEAPAPPAAQATAPIPMEVVKPEGRGPFPAVVMLHDCSGLGPGSSGSPARWARLLVRDGYVVITPDSFSTRGFASGVCTNPSPTRAEVSPQRRVRDAYAALDRLRTLSYVDATRVGVMGGSHGGSSTLATLGLLARPPGAPRFAAGIALYPGCNARYGEWRPGTPGVYKPLAPLLILTGALDDWTPAAPCAELAQRSQDAGLPVAIKVYPGAHHAFDSNRPVRYVETRVNGNAPSGRGATTGGNAAAWADSIAEVKAFFARHLRP